MISKSLSPSFPIQALIAFVVVITWGLTSFVNAAAAVPPARFARDPRSLSVSESVPALMMPVARLHKGRDANGDDTNPNDLTNVNDCTSDPLDFNCLIKAPSALEQCSDPTTQSNLGGLEACIQAFCPGTSPAVILCVINPNLIEDEGDEAGIVGACITNIEGDAATCIKANYAPCGDRNDKNGIPNGAAFGQCMSQACPNILGVTISCLAGNYGREFF